MLAGGGLLTACSQTGGDPQLPAPTHTQLMAGHQQMEADHHRMEAADSVMEAEHAAALAAAEAQGLHQAPAFQILETRHRAFMTLCRRAMRYHAQVLARHAALERRHATGQVPAVQLQRDHATMRAEDLRMQQEHDRLVEEHQKMEREHVDLLKEISRR
ncbi:hypothetical protein BEN47_18570 [Hymenobacter lapidarius]|uniref:DUF4398 domain-containing protein n=1 Tax=Hymenobacter lapidarius TaxID=1908237 RepID=A0A1G1SUV8_9BACT|nr:hypothetical protein BEN47_18570 [Hymenobacter lapidarius]